MNRGTALTNREFYEHYNTYPEMLLQSHFVREKNTIKQSIVEEAVRSLCISSDRMRADEIVQLLPILIRRHYLTFDKNPSLNDKEQNPLFRYFKYVDPDLRPED